MPFSHRLDTAPSALRPLRRSGSTPTFSFTGAFFSSGNPIRGRQGDGDDEDQDPTAHYAADCPGRHFSLAHRHTAHGARAESVRTALPAEDGGFPSRSAFKNHFVTVASAIGLRKYVSPKAMR
jgi:hypothetical protein